MDIPDAFSYELVLHPRLEDIPDAFSYELVLHPGIDELS